MEGLAYKPGRATHIVLDLKENDIPNLREGRTLEYNCREEQRDICIPTIKFKVVDVWELPDSGRFIGKGFYIRYHPRPNPKTCWVKIDRKRFKELLETNWIMTRHGSNHLHIRIYIP